MKLVKKIKQKFCTHKYQVVHEYERDINPTVGYEKGKVYVLYCPKCKKSKEILETEYNIFMGKMEADRNHKRS